MLGVIGGSGFYTFFDEDARSVELDTPYGPPSAPITVGPVGDHEVAFLPRHGVHHEFSPHTVPYRANMWALRALGVRRIFGPCAVGSLTPELGPGAMVVPDQLVDRTSGASDTYFDSGGIHVGFADPYCPTLRRRRAGLPGVVDGGTMVVIQGPRFSTRAESQWYARQGFTLINMTGYPEAVLARELEMCYAAIALVTDLDAGIDVGSGVHARSTCSPSSSATWCRSRSWCSTPSPRCPANAPARTACPTTACTCRSSCREGAAHRRGRVHRLPRRPPRWRPQGHEVVGVDVMLRRRARPGQCCPPEAASASTSATPTRWRPLLSGVDVVCHQAAMVGAGVNAADAPALRQPQRLRDHGAAGADVRRRRATGWCWRRRWWCTGRAVTSVPAHGPVDPLPRRREDLDAGVFEHRCPIGGEQLSWRLVDEDAPLRPRSLYAASKTAQEHYALAWCDAVEGSVVALRYHNVYGPGMPRDTPYSGVAAIFRSALEKGEPPQVFEDGGQMRDFVHVDDVAAANVAAVHRPGAAGSLPSNVCSGQPISIRRGGPSSCRGPTAGRRRRSPASTAAATSATSSPTPPVRGRSWASPRASTPKPGCANSPPPLCAPDARNGIPRGRFSNFSALVPSRRIVDAVQRRLIYFPSPGPVPPASTVTRGAQDVVLRTDDGLQLGAWFFPAVTPRC